jgi:hypothetical protein
MSELGAQDIEVPLEKNYEQGADDSVGLARVLLIHRRLSSYCDPCMISGPQHALRILVAPSH